MVADIMQDPFVIYLPLPPSSNNAFATVGRRRIRSRAYLEWVKNADAILFYDAQYSLKCQNPIKGKFSLRIEVPVNMRGDISNRIKILEDYFVSREVTADDRFCQEILIRREKNMVEGCKVIIYPIAWLGQISAEIVSRD